MTEVCDNDASDFDNAPGVAFGAIPAGQYTLTQTAAAEGFNPAAPVAVEHGVDATVLEMVNQPATEETGTVELAIRRQWQPDRRPVLHPRRSHRELWPLLRQR